MFEAPESKREEKRPAESIDKVLLDAIRGVIYEPHEQHVEYDEDLAYDRGSQDRARAGDSGGGSSILPMVLVGAALGAIGYMYGKRSGQGGAAMGDTPGKIQSATDRASHRTEEIAGRTAESIRESGKELSDRTEETAEQTADRLEESGEEYSERIEESGSEASDKMEDSD
jgi:hypothetical protein